jgi:hypothetical protein
MDEELVGENGEVVDFSSQENLDNLNAAQLQRGRTFFDTHLKKMSNPNFD